MLRSVQLDPSSAEPIYRQLHRILKQMIETGELERGEKIPPTRELAGQLGLNRTTIAAAYELLESEGLIRGHVGRGSFVEGPPAEPARFSWQGLLTERTPAIESPTTAPQGASVTSFASSRPSEELFPLDEFRAACEEVLASRQLSAVLQLGAPGGYQPLRRYLVEQAARRNLLRTQDELLVTSGCQQAIDLLQRTLVAAGDTVLTEDPVYPGLKNVFLRAGARVVGVPVGASGLDMDALTRAVMRERPRLIVVTPSFQNPTGLTMPLQARETLLRVALEAGVPVIENDIYGDLRYEGEALPSLKQLDASGSVIQVKSFSKVAFPGLRVGWMTGHRSVLSRVIETKQWTDLHTDHLSQAVLLRFAETGRLEAHLQKVLAAGAQRLHAALDACQRYLPDGTRFTRPQGGMSLWVRLPEPLDAGELLPQAERENITYLPGKYFTVSRPDPGGFRLSFAGLAPQKIEAGLAVLGRVFQNELERAHAARRADFAPAIV